MQTTTSLTLVVLVASSLILAPTAAADAKPDQPAMECKGETHTGTADSFSQIEYLVTYNWSAQRVCVAAENAGEQTWSFYHAIRVDDRQIVPGNAVRLDPGEKFQRNQTIMGGIDATRNNHTVEVPVTGNTFYFNFTQKIDPMNESGVPTPHVENLSVKRNGTKSGQPRLVVSVDNEGMRTYVPRAEVRTSESDARYLDGVPDASPGGRYSVRLSEDNDDVIVGTIRLYGGTFNPETKFDRVSFVSYPNGTHETWEPEFEEIPTAREIEDREVYYGNETAKERYRGPDVDPVSGRASRAGAVTLVALVVCGVWYRWRSG